MPRFCLRHLHGTSYIPSHIFFHFKFSKGSCHENYLLRLSIFRLDVL